MSIIDLTDILLTAPVLYAIVPVRQNTQTQSLLHTLTHASQSHVKPYN